MEFWRVVNWNPTVSEATENGHPLFVWPRQGAGRVDDPNKEYHVLYLGDTPEGAVAEAFGSYAHWSAPILAAPPQASVGTVKAIARFEGEPAILDLDDPYALEDWGLRPSGVVSRDREFTQQWASAMYAAGGHDGVSWWSYYEPRWASFGLWDVRALTIADEPEPLNMNHDAIQNAASVIRRIIAT